MDRNYSRLNWGDSFFVLLQAFDNKKHSQQDRWDSKSEFRNGRNVSGGCKKQYKIKTFATGSLKCKKKEKSPL